MPYNQAPTTAENQNDNSAFIISVKCSRDCSFTLSIDIQGYARKMVEGLPYTLLVNSVKLGACVQFLSLAKNTSTYVHIASSNASNLRYDVRCYNKENFT